MPSLSMPGKRYTSTGEREPERSGDERCSMGGRGRSPTMNDGGRLCLACGMCCDGSLFGLVRLGAAEVARMTRLGLPVFSPDDHPALKQPCRALNELTCTV